MALESGTKLGTYEIHDLLGKGGMGEVYRARDTKLGREVAIKVLPAEFARDQERVARLEREARMLAALNHPNIAAIYGLEQSGDTRFIVLELVEGDTVADQIERGAIPVEESLKLALQIAEALEAAHERGVIHRDLKPANIKITPEGRVKVLDFGLAKAFIGDSADVDLSNSPTLSMAATQAGLILGTAAYMSPEQASGEVADHRADIWAFGVVLFEMLSGRQLFAGKTASHVMGAVLEREPDWDSLPANLHPTVRELLERCLQKEAKNRRQAIVDVRFDVQSALADPGGAILAGAARAGQPQRSWVWATGVVLAATVVGVGVWLLRPAPEAHGIVRFPFILPAEQVLSDQLRRVVDISRDGTKFAYSADNRIYVRDLEDTEPRLVQGTEEANQGQPVFSPDGLNLAYHIGGAGNFAIRSIPVEGGAPVTVWQGPSRPLDIRWEADDTILFVQPEGIFRTSANGGEAEVVVQSDGRLLGTPSLLPNGDLLFTVSTAGQGLAGWDAGQIAVQTPRTTERRVIWEGGGDARYVPTGHIVYAQGNDLFALPFDIDSLERVGGATSIVENIARGNETGTGQYAVSDNGTLVHLHSESAGLVGPPLGSLFYSDMEGSLERIAIEPDSYSHARVSPDGTQLAVQMTTTNGGTDVWVYPLDGSSVIRNLTQDGLSSRPIWSHDSQRVTFMSTREGTASIWWQVADGSAPAEQLTSSDGPEHWPDAWSPDGETLVFLSFPGLGSPQQQSIMTLSLTDADTQPQMFVDGFSGGPSFSPSGEWVVYNAARQEDVLDNQIYLKPFPLDPVRHEVSQAGGAYPIFSPDGSELVYRRPAAGDIPNQLVRIPISTDPLRFGTESVIPIPGLPRTFGIREYDMTPDGELLLMLPEGSTEDAAEAEPTEFRVVLNWFEELKDRVPVP